MQPLWKTVCRLLKKLKTGSSHCDAVETSLTGVHEDAGLIPGLSGLRLWHCVNCGVGRRRGSDLSLLWLWHKPAAAAPM